MCAIWTINQKLSLKMRVHCGIPIVLLLTPFYRANLDTMTIWNEKTEKFKAFILIPTTDYFYQNRKYASIPNFQPIFPVRHTTQYLLDCEFCACYVYLKLLLDRMNFSFILKKKNFSMFLSCVWWGGVPLLEYFS